MISTGTRYGFGALRVGGPRPRQRVSGPQQHRAELAEDRPGRIATAVDETESSDADIEETDERGDRKHLRVAAPQVRPDPDERRAERQHAAAHEKPDDIEHRVHIGLNRI